MEEDNRFYSDFPLGWKAPRTLDKVDRYEEQSHYDYIGAPGGEEWPIPNTWEVDAGVYGTIRGIDYPSDKKISISQLEENFHKQANIELEKYYVGNAFNAQAAIQDGVPTSVVIKHMLDNKDYSKLSNININKGQGCMFSYTNSSPAANPLEELVKRQQEFKKKVQGSKPSDSFEAFKKFTNKLVGKSKTYRPLPDCLTIKESSIDGLGVFATEDIILDRFYTFLGYTHYVVDGELFRVNYGGFLNHSNTPNCKLYAISKEENYEAYQLTPIRDIKANEELTLNYNKELCGLSGYDGADFLKEDKLEDRVYETEDGIRYYYNSIYGKFESTYGTFNNNPIFYTPEDAEKFLKRVK